jgi:hypothetical protein
MRAFSRVVAVGLMAALLLLALAAIGPWSIGDDAPRSRPHDRVELPVPYDSSFINSWVRGCVASGWSVAFCRCAMDEYTTRLRPDEFETAAAVANSGGTLAELPEHLRGVVKDVERDCR